MSCKDCEYAEEIGKRYYIRIENANVGIIACEKHAKIVMNAVNGPRERRENE